MMRSLEAVGAESAPVCRNAVSRAKRHARATCDEIADNDDLRITASPQFRNWMLAHRISVAFSTYDLGRLVLIGAGKPTLNVAEESFDSAMALLTSRRGMFVGTHDRLWRFENALLDGGRYQGADRLYLPQDTLATGSLDIHDLDLDRTGRVLAAATRFNCIAAIERGGHFTPVWRPRFIDATVAEDRCHLSGFCTDHGTLAYATLIGASNVADGWREQRADGGQVIDIREQNVVASHLAMPHAPRLYEKRLWLLESGSGWFGWVDLARRRFERLCWLPGFLRGLRFVGDYAVIGTSAPRNGSFAGLPLHDELSWRTVAPVSGLHVVNMKSGTVEHRLTVGGAVREIFDLAMLPDCIAPRISTVPVEHSAD